jgi:hypothetical protein
VRRPRFDHLSMIGWQPLGTVQIVNWCGHRHGYVPWPKSLAWNSLRVSLWHKALPDPPEANGERHKHDIDCTRPDHKPSECQHRFVA